MRLMMSKVLLSAIADINIGGTPSRQIDSFWAKEDGYSWVSIADLTSSGKYIINTKEKITIAGINNSNVKLVPKGCFIMSFKLTIGKCALAGTNLYTNEAIASFMPKYKDAFIPEYLYYALPNVDFHKYTDSAIKGITLNKQKLSNIEINVPDLPTQKRIAKILSTVDGQIEKTEAIIAKYQAIKQGMLHDLFTRGIDLATGKLRPLPEHSPELYKSSPLGLIPKDWEYMEFEKIITKLVHGGTPSTANIKYWTGDIPWVSGADFLDNFSTGEIRRHITQNAVLESSCNIVPKENILLVTRTGVGKLSKTNCEIAISQDITGIIADKNLVNNSWLYYYLQLIVKDFKKLNQGTSINGILKNDLLSKLLMLSSINEQAAIQNKIEIIDNLIKQETLILNKNIQLKNSLMINLLSSKVE